MKKIIKKIIKIIGIILMSITLLVGLIVGGGYLYMKVQQKYMEKVVYSEEAAQLFREGCKNLDPKAFTKEGVIHSYTIDKSSIKHNPMGGINVTLFINNNNELYCYSTLDKNSVTGELEDNGGGYSSKLDKLLEDHKK